MSDDNLNLLIVEDERLHREAIAEALPWDKLGVTVVGAVRNGVEAIQALNARPADIILVDVRMPGMDGLELAHRLREKRVPAQIIFLSAFDDSEYIRSALRADARDYLLKPVDGRELAEAVTRARDRIQRLRTEETRKQGLLDRIESDRSIVAQHVFRALVGEMEPLDDNELQRANFPLGACRALVVLLTVDQEENRPDGSSNQNDASAAKGRLQSLIRDLDLPHCDLPDEAFALLVHRPEREPEERLLSTARSLAQELQTSFRANTGRTVSAAIGPLVDRIRNVGTSLRVARTRLEQRFFLGSGCLVFADHIPRTALITEERIAEWELRIDSAIAQADRGRTRQTLSQIFALFREAEMVDTRLVRRICTTLVNNLQFAIVERGGRLSNIVRSDGSIWDELGRLTTLDGIESWMKRLFEAALRFIIGEPADSRSRVVREMLDYVTEHYASDISLKSLAAKLNYSANYLGSVFKAEVGQRFHDYLISLRMRHAVTMLADPKLRVYEIAELVGYANVAAFDKQFRHRYDMTPSEYRKRI